jgi:hypothetical protein
MLFAGETLDLSLVQRTHQCQNNARGWFHTKTKNSRELKLEKPEFLGFKFAFFPFVFFIDCK